MKTAPTLPTNSSQWNSWDFTEKAVLTFIRQNDEVLLIHKKRGLGKGKVNAPGGRIDPGETALNAAIRECEEEVGLTPHNLLYLGELNFIFMDGYSLQGFVFLAESYSGTLIETDEALPFWCPVDAIPYEKMWEDDQYWLPQMLEGETFLGRFVFDNDTMCSMQIIPAGQRSPQPYF